MAGGWFDRAHENPQPRSRDALWSPMGISLGSNGFHCVPVTSEAKKNSLNGPVLIVDDNKINRVLLSRYLSVLNIKVDEAESAADAILACKITNYRIILMHLQMPIIDGVEATKIIREQKSNLDTAIFAVSASSKEIMKKKCKDVDFTGFIPKPIDREELIRIVSQYC